MRDKVRSSDYVVTFHARKEMQEEDLETDDVEHAILTGRIVERQKDRITSEWKYVVSGIALDDCAVELVAKIGPTGKLVIVTVYKR